ncbi:TIGR02921 family PEP-CTERM protein [Iningainema tapete]|uniref:TIGR02921 family PEP-CTERM protein n=1 Tax=Iningainema tapete BLCC-T55 TaxID=2748662 RepID=A0A8J7BX71_9CYAN|nr:TIGR02921 family PEP-CTERM protein [Iningainema tapete]MBD2772368.1 TIGR02921 family PEP-CTERM protein [Iningainema tapete BLCC-T55]
MKWFLHTLFHAIFWIWNLAFLSVVYVGILPWIAPVIIIATFEGLIPLEFFVSLVALITVPTICTIVGVRHFSQQPVNLMRLFYGVEAPLFALCLMRLFLFREVPPASGWVLGTLCLCIGAFFLNLSSGYANRNRILAWTQAFAHSLMVLIGLYVGAVLMFYAIPTAVAIIREFFSFNWVSIFIHTITYAPYAIIWWVFIFFILVGITSTLFVAMPSALASLYILSGREILQAFASQYGRKRTWGVSLGVVTAWLLILFALQQQPQVAAFNLFQNPPTTDSSKQALLAKSDTIKAGLVNAYLSSYRYLSSNQENNHIQHLYHDFLGLPNGVAQRLQTIYNSLMSPFLYQGLPSDADKASKLYAEFFDTPIQRAERQAINHALQSTFNRDEAKAGLLNINQEKVWLAKQQVTVKENGDWADVELYEVYENQTPEQQEVFYSFSLPESAVITGLWLGNSDKLSDRFPFAVSPRGAAQQVYNQEVQRRVDPALLEQVGTRHYRLRAFPIPPKTLSGKPELLHLWLTYKVMQQQNGWAMPQLGEKRNIFWTNHTKYIRNGKTVSSPNDWLEPFISAAKLQPASHEVNFPEGYRISAQPLTAGDYSTLKGKRLAIVVDTSRSMGKHTQELSQTFASLKATSNDADVYITTSQGVPQRIDDLQRLTKLTFYGSIQLQQMMQQFLQLRGNTNYDAILMVTDEGSYELSQDSKNVLNMPAPLWMVHLGKLPPAYDDATLAVIQDSGGGVATQVAEVLQRIGTQARLGSSTVSVVDGYAWNKSKVESVATTKKDFEQLAARQLVVGLSQEKKAKQLKDLDAIHAIAKKFKIVTPYSSMIVLVNDRQKEALKRAEAKSDRFEREVESGQEQLTQPSNPFTVSATPEPEEWMLMAMVVIALIFIARRRLMSIRQ